MITRIAIALVICTSAYAQSYRTCLTPYWGGIVPGVSQDRDVQLLHGLGYFDPQLGHGGGRYFTDSTESITVMFEIGVDSKIETTTFELGLHFPKGSPKKLSPYRSMRLDADEHFSDYRIILGSTSQDLQDGLGKPKKKQKNTWVYEFSGKSGCGLIWEVTFEFHKDKIIKVTIWSAS